MLKDALHSHGLEYRNTTNAVAGSIAPGRAVVAYTHPASTAEEFADPTERAAYLEMLEQMGARASTVFGALGSELTRGKLIKLGLGALRAQKLSGLQALAHNAVMSGRAFTRSRFTGS